jgi:hypothetical protein
VGEVLAGVLRCYERYPALFIELTLAVVLPYALVVWLVSGRGLLGGGHRYASATLIVFLVETLIVTPLISALHMHALTVISQDRERRAPGLSLFGASGSCRSSPQLRLSQGFAPA